MRQVTETIAAATLSGRELALRRRQVMALHGKTGWTKQRSSQRSTAGHQAFSAAPAMSSANPNLDNSDSELVKRIAAAINGRSVSRARREAMNQVGKSAIKPVSGSPNGRRRPSRHQATMGNKLATDTTPDLSAKTCNCDSCDCKNNAHSNHVTSNVGDSSFEQQTYSASTVASHFNGKNTVNPTSRALARARRAALAQDGKTGLKRVMQATKIATSMPDTDWQSAIAKGATGRQLAMQRRLVSSIAGRTSNSSEESRPAGRLRPTRSLAIPPKVEIGHTLSGQTVTGTMVERSQRVTGNEPGSCRPVTGTEYIGAEQFMKLCETRPEPSPAKVGVSNTLRSHKVTGTELGRSTRVTGDEPGACRSVTGTEYLAAERFDEFCASRPAPTPAKVNIAWTQKEKAVTGTSVVNIQKVTGNEPGADRFITGTNYTQQAADTAPEKVIVSHTSHGRSVTGTAVGHTAKITGDESGACHNNITGTEYLAVEQFKDICHTEPNITPHKVSVMSSRDNHRVSGTEVGRSSKVTGDEPGSCRSITGSQYYTASDFGDLCNVNGPRKVNSMQTLSNQTVTGTEVRHSPKLTGDDRGVCKPVTGIDYVGANPEGCTVDTPVSPVSKVFVDQTLRGQPVTGSYVGRSTRVTGDEYGDCASISGTPYIGRNQYGSFCESSDLLAQKACIPTSATVSAAAVTGDRPGANGSVMTGDERGACEVVTGTPYIGADNIADKCVSNGQLNSRARHFEEPALPQPPADFSIKSPARRAWDRRIEDDIITGYVYTDERITGPVNKACGLITGTPEFRHRESKVSVDKQDETIAASRRLTGEGKQLGLRITGDSWYTQKRVTGTEGASSLTRNLSLRGESRGGGSNAQHFREIERPPVPESRITGSSGSTTKGAVVTVSGGARA